MELTDGGLYVDKHFHRFLPYRHLSIDKMWLVFQFRDEYEEGKGNREGQMITIEERWTVFGNTPLLAVLAARNNYRRDEKLRKKYNKEHERQALLFRYIRMIDKANVNEFKELCKPLKLDLGKRKDAALLVEDVNFYKGLIDMLNRFNKLIVKMNRKILYQENKLNPKEKKKDGKKTDKQLNSRAA